MNTPETLPLVGIYRPRPHGPGFGIPVFSHDGQYWVQEVSSEDRVTQFVACDVEQQTLRRLTSPTDLRMQGMGQQALYAFEATDGTMTLGTRQEVRQWLRDKVVELQTAPFVLYDVVEFLGDAELITEAREGCDALIQQSRKVPEALVGPSETTSPTPAIQGLSHLLILVGDLVQRTRDHAPGEKQALFEHAVVVHTSRFIEELQESAKASCNGSWQDVAPGWQDVHTRAEALEKGLREEREKRMREIAHPASEGDFLTNLRWLVERGKEDDLRLLQSLKHNPPYTSDEISQLLDLAMQRIQERRGQRDNAPATGLRQEEEAYWNHKEEWDRRYAGCYIAIYGGKVITYDTKKTRLMDKIIKKQTEQGPFRAYIINVGSLVVGG
jgi:hypothetical protein